MQMMKKAYIDALMRHMEFYNSEGTAGCLIHGIALSMEEKKQMVFLFQVR